MANKNNGFTPDWTEEAKTEKSYRSIFKIRNPGGQRGLDLQEND